MRIRPYSDKDFASVSKWITDERSHALWCANLFPYPLEKHAFDDLLFQSGERNNDSPFTATTDEGEAAGFFCFSVDLNTNEGMIKFVIINDSLRNKGYGSEMIMSAVKYAFEIAKADSVQLNVFSPNAGAIKCYRNAGFAERKFTENAFEFKDELWGRCNMVIEKHRQICPERKIYKI